MNVKAPSPESRGAENWSWKIINNIMLFDLIYNKTGNYEKHEKEIALFPIKDAAEHERI